MRRSQFAMIVTFLCLLCAMGPLSTDMYLPSIPAIAEDLAAPVQTVQISVSVFFLGMGIGQVFYGPLADALGRRRVILMGTVIFLAASFAAVFANSISLFIALRLFQALGAAAGVVVINAVMRDLFDGIEFVRAVSVTMLTINIAPLVAPILGGFMAALGWRPVFMVLSAYALMLILLVTFMMPETLSRENRQSLRPGAVFRNYLEVLTSVRSFGVVMAQMAHGAGMFAFIAGSPYVYMNIYGANPGEYGFLFAANIVSIALCTALNGRIAGRFGPLRTLFGALIISFTGGVLLVISVHLHFESILSVLIPVLIFICTLGVVGSNATAYVLGLYPEKSGTASAAMGALRFAGGAAAGIILNSFEGAGALPFAWTIFVCAALALGVFWISRIWIRRHAREEAAS